MNSVCTIHIVIERLVVMDLIYEFIKIRSILETISQERHTKMTRDMLKQVSDHIDQHCQHVIVRDTIDISPEESKTIYYCEHCWKTFDPDECTLS
jgi:hypothetical protein